MNQEKPRELKALIIDDERLARKELITLLEAYSFITIAAQADSVESALTEIQRTNPDVLFLDIQMPRKSGFDLLNEANFTGRVIFVTAYDEYAIRAFEINALDYLLKPVSPERLNRSMQRLLEEHPAAESFVKMIRYDDRLFLSFSNQLKFIPVSAIILVTAEKDYTMIHLSDGKQGLVIKSMREWEERLPGNYFCRIHRSAIINIERVERVEKWFNNTLRIYLKGVHEPLTASRRYAATLKEKFS